jgi:hypothetical protein
VQYLTFVTALERIITAPFGEVFDISIAIEGRTRARLAVFCYARAHLREKGIAIASNCRFSDLVAESSAHVAESLRALATPVMVVDQQRRTISLAGVAA